MDEIRYQKNHREYEDTDALHQKTLHLGLLLLSHNGKPIQLLFGKEKQLLFSMT